MKMFLFTGCRQNILLLSIICGLLLFTNNAKAAAPGKCVNFGEYCQNHWDCCSNSCLSFLWRCTRGYPEKEKEIITTRFGSANDVGPVYSSLQDIIESNFGKDTRTEQPTVSFTSRFDIHGQQQPTIRPAKVDYETTRAFDNDQRLKCKEIGIKCYSNDECCSQRCHGFLHQCVT